MKYSPSNLQITMFLPNDKGLHFLFRNVLADVYQVLTLNPEQLKEALMLRGRIQTYNGFQVKLFHSDLWISLKAYLTYYMNDRIASEVLVEFKNNKAFACLRIG